MKVKFTSEEVLDSFDGIQRAEPNPFLFTRIQARMAAEDKSTVFAVVRFITRPAFALSIAFLFVFINGYLLMNQLESSQANAEEMGQAVAMEYVQHTVNPYDQNELP
jgi:hypothetical protein